MLFNEDYTLEDLTEYIREELSGLVWRVEGLDQTRSRSIHNAVQDGIMAYSRRVPIPRYRVVRTQPSQIVYDIGDCGYGVARVDFLNPTVVASPFLASLLGVSPIMSMEGRDFDLFLRWRKSFARVTSIEPKWRWDEEIKKLLINNATFNIFAGVTTYHPRDFAHIRLIHKDWLKRYALAKCRYKLGEVRSKYGDKVPGPGGDISLNGTKLIDDAKADIEKLEKELFQFQTVPVVQWS